VTIVDLSLPIRPHVRWKTEEWATHHTFFPAGIAVIEYLVNLDRLSRDRVRFAALPLKLDGGDGAPARAIAIVD
jgi:kynurenine formamidase